MGSSEGERTRILRALWRDKMHVEADAIERASPRIAAAFETVWGPADRLLEALAVFPPGLMAYWRDLAVGHVVFTHRQSEYCPGRQVWQRWTYVGICYISLADLVPSTEPALRVWLTMLDHLLGSGSEGDGRFSGGIGATERLNGAAKRFAEAYALGYGSAELGSADAGEYLADAVMLYLRDRAALNAIDPLAERLLRQTLMDEAFWSQAAG